MKKIGYTALFVSALALGACSDEEPATGTETGDQQAEAEQATQAEKAKPESKTAASGQTRDEFKFEHPDAGLIMYTDDKQVYRFEADGETRYAIFEEGVLTGTSEESPE